MWSWVRVSQPGSRNVVTTRLGREGWWAPGTAQHKSPQGATWMGAPCRGGGLCSPSQHSDFCPRRQGSGSQAPAPPHGLHGDLPWGLAAPSPHLSPSLELPSVFVPHTVSPPLDILVLGQEGPASSASVPFADGDTEARVGPGRRVCPRRQRAGAVGRGHQACFLDGHTASSLHPPGPCLWSHGALVPPTPDPGGRCPQWGRSGGSRCPLLLR